MLNRLAALFQKAWDVTENEFIAKLERGGIKYTVNRIQGWTYIEVGRFGYRFEQGQSRGGWIRHCGPEDKAEWDRWFALLREPV